MKALSAIGRQTVVLEARFSFRKPANPEPHEEIFGVPVRFDQPRTGVNLSNSSLARKLTASKPRAERALRSGHFLFAYGLQHHIPENKTDDDLNGGLKVIVGHDGNVP